MSTSLSDGKSINRLERVALFLVALPVVFLTRLTAVIRPLAPGAPLQRFIRRRRRATRTVPVGGGLAGRLGLGELQHVQELELRRDAAEDEGA